MTQPALLIVDSVEATARTAGNLGLQGEYAEVLTWKETRDALC